MWFEEKIHSGKLIAIRIMNGTVNVSGDFFLHPEDRINAIEDALTVFGSSTEITEAEVETAIVKAIGDGMFVGASALNFARLFMKARGVEKTEPGVVKKS